MSVLKLPFRSCASASRETINIRHRSRLHVAPEEPTLNFTRSPAIFAWELADGTESLEAVSSRRAPHGGPSRKLRGLVSLRTDFAGG